MPAVVSPAAAAEKFRGIFLSEESGTLVVRSETHVFSILFDRGMVAGAQVRDHAGSAVDTGPGESSVQQIVRQAFGCVPSSIELIPDTTSLQHEYPVDILRTVNLFLSSMESFQGFEDVRAAMMALDSKLVLKTNPTVPIECLMLRPVHGFILSRLGGDLSFREIASTLGADNEDEAARFIFSLLLLGCVAPDPPFAHGPVRTEQILMDHKRDFAREAAETNFIRETYNTVQTQNPYQILGIDETAGPEEIRRAYEERKLAVSADRFLDKVRETMRSELSIIDGRLAEVLFALQTSSPQRTAPEDPDFDMGNLSLRREVTKTEVAASINEQERLAESYFLKAKKYFGQGDYYNCIQYCTQAIRQNDQEARYYFLLGEAQVRNPDRRWQKMAEHSFLQAIKLDPWNADFYFTLGQFYKRQGLSVRARRQFERALEIQPSLTKAADEILALG